MAGGIVSISVFSSVTRPYASPVVVSFFALGAPNLQALAAWALSHTSAFLPGQRRLRDGGRPPTLTPLSSKCSGGLWLSASLLHMARREESAEPAPLLRHVKGELTLGGLAACFVTPAKPAFIPLQGQFAVCDLWKGNGT